MGNMNRHDTTGYSLPWIYGPIRHRLKPSSLRSEKSYSTGRPSKTTVTVCLLKVNLRDSADVTVKNFSVIIILNLHDLVARFVNSTAADEFNR